MKTNDIVLLHCLSSQGVERERMLEGITNQHAAIRAVNPRWILDLLRQVPSAVDNSSANLGNGNNSNEVSDDNSIIRPAELRVLAHRHGPWWI